MTPEEEDVFDGLRREFPGSPWVKALALEAETGCFSALHVLAYGISHLVRVNDRLTREHAVLAERLHVPYIVVPKP